MANILRKNWKQPKKKTKSSVLSWEARKEMLLKVKKEREERKSVVLERRRKKSEYIKAANEAKNKDVK